VKPPAGTIRSFSNKTFHHKIRSAFVKAAKNNVATRKTRTSAIVEGPRDALGRFKILSTAAAA